MFSKCWKLIRYMMVTFPKRRSEQAVTELNDRQLADIGLDRALVAPTEDPKRSLSGEPMYAGWYLYRS